MRMAAILFTLRFVKENERRRDTDPFYVTVAASFVQLYNNNIGGEAIGLVMFDEAFNNMDDERIGAVLEVYEQTAASDRDRSAAG